MMTKENITNDFLKGQERALVLHQISVRSKYVFELNSTGGRANPLSPLLNLNGGVTKAMVLPQKENNSS